MQHTAAPLDEYMNGFFRRAAQLDRRRQVRAVAGLIVNTILRSIK